MRIWPENGKYKENRWLKRKSSRPGIIASGHLQSGAFADGVGNQIRAALQGAGARAAWVWFAWTRGGEGCGDVYGISINGVAAESFGEAPNGTGEAPVLPIGVRLQF